jgi:hypothetical protein
MLKTALFAGAIVAAFGCQDRTARDAAMAGAGAGAPAPVVQTVDRTGTTNQNTGTNVPAQARRTPIARRSTTQKTTRGTTWGFGTRYTAPSNGLSQTASGNGTTTKTATDSENAGTSTP